MSFSMNKQEFINRLKRIFLELKERKLVSYITEFATSIGTYNHVIGAMFNGKLKRTLNLNQISALTQKYGIDANYLFGKSEKMFLDKSNLISHEEDVLGEEISQFDKEQLEKTAIANFIITKRTLKI